MSIGDMEFECAACGVRLDPMMTAQETQYFLTNGCIMCHQNCWRLVPPEFDPKNIASVAVHPISDEQYDEMTGEEE